MSDNFYENKTQGAVFVGDCGREREMALWSFVGKFLSGGGKVFIFNREGGVVSVPSKNICMACLRAEDFSKVVDKYLSFAEDCKRFLLKKRFKSFGDYFEGRGLKKNSCAIVVPSLESLLGLENGEEILQKLIQIEKLSVFSGVSVMLCSGSGLQEEVANWLSFSFQNKFIFSLGQDALVRKFTLGKIGSSKNLSRGESYFVSLDEGIGRVVNFCL